MASLLAVGPASATGQGETSCDPALELCLLDAEPWIAPQHVRYRGPAEADERLVLRWAQEGSRGGVEGTIVDRTAQTVTWRATLPATLENGELSLTALVRSPRYRSLAEGSVRRASARERLVIQERDSNHRALLRFRARTDVQAVIVVWLQGRYPAERWEVARRWQVRRNVRGGGARTVALEVERARRICRRYARCRLRARARVRAVGKTVAQRTAGRSVPTPRERFSGRLGLVPGSTPVSGPGRVYRYTVHVERGIKIDRPDFARQVQTTLFHDRSWGRTGRVAFQQVGDPSRSNTRVILASPAMVDRLCFPLRTNGYVSCQIRQDIVLNLNRWRYGVPHFKRRLQYRRMLTNHEMGHRLGHGHRSCPGRGRLAPVMQQQTYSLQGCRPNAWPVSFELAATR